MLTQDSSCISWNGSLDYELDGFLFLVRGIEPTIVWPIEFCYHGCMVQLPRGEGDVGSLDPGRNDAPRTKIVSTNSCQVDAEEVALSSDEMGVQCCY